jgi:glycosyltransferase involved in cell wall biosynthesis
MRKVSAIICAYNEEKTIENVIRSVSQAQIVTEIIVVNDGSNDKTKEIIESLKSKIPLKAIHFDENKGKGYAMATGVENADGEIITFIDADISGLSDTHLKQLVNPLIRNEADMVLGFPTKTMINYKINPYKHYTGERSLFKTELEPLLNKIKYSEYGVEWLINQHFKENKKNVLKIYLEGLQHFSKYEKNKSFLKATKEILSEHLNILKTAVKNRFKLFKI